MTDTRPSPLVPAEVDLRDFPFMPVDVHRLLTSETWILATGDERAAAMTLWLTSWHQVPAGSVPMDERMLAHLSQAGAKWKKVKAHALRGWIEASDGRLYHPVVAEKALEAWVAKLAYSLSGTTGNAKRWGVAIDTDSIRDRALVAIGMLRTLAPQSETLKKKAVVLIESQSRGESGGDSRGDKKSSGGESQPESGRDRKGEGEGEGDSKPLQHAPTGSNEVAPPQPAAPPAPEPAKGTRSGAVAILLRNLGVKVTPMHPDCIAWAEQGVTDDQLRQAVGLARVSKPDPIPIPASYLKPIVAQVTAPTTATPSPQGARNGKFNVHAYGRELLAEALAAESLGNRPASEAGPALQPQVHELLPRSGNRE